MDVGGMSAESEPSLSILLHSVVVQQIAAEGKSDKMTSDVDEHVNQMCGIEFLDAEKIALTDIP